MAMVLSLPKWPTAPPECNSRMSWSLREVEGMHNLVPLNKNPSWTTKSAVALGTLCNRSDMISRKSLHWEYSLLMLSKPTTFTWSVCRWQWPDSRHQWVCYQHQLCVSTQKCIVEGTQPILHVCDSIFFECSNTSRPGGQNITQIHKAIGNAFSA